MKTRIIKTRLWTEDEKFGELSMVSKLSFLFLITNSRIGMTGIYECPNRRIRFETGINDQQLKSAKKELTENKMVVFYKGWVYIVNAEKHNNYKKGEKNIIAYRKEKEAIPKEIIKYFDSSIDTIIYSSPNTETRNKKLEIRNKNVVRSSKARDYLEYWNKTYETNYTSIKAIGSNLDIWLKEYSFDDICKAIEKVKDHEYWKNGMTPITLLRTRTPKGEPVDYIGEMLNYKPDKLRII